VLDEGSREIESVGFAVDYLEARHADTLAKVEALKDGPLRLLVAARLGATRLIDNVAV
jgi:pantoate--beta-alanine ligase